MGALGGKQQLLLDQLLLVGFDEHLAGLEPGGQREEAGHLILHGDDVLSAQVGPTAQLVNLSPLVCVGFNRGRDWVVRLELGLDQLGLLAKGQSPLLRVQDVDVAVVVDADGDDGEVVGGDRAL